MWSLRFDQTIGAGAFGTVYLAELKNESGLRRPVAVKMIVQGHSDSEMFLTRMRDEARLLGMLKDRNVLQVLDLIQLDGRDAIIMEYVNGADLEAVLDTRGPLSAKSVCEIGAVIGGALERAHQATHPKDGTPLGVVHRDVKPANIMMTNNGELRLLDFGVARARFAARESSTGQLVLGTLNYMAPDYIITGEVHPALDVYGLALTLWELATGEVYGQPKVREDLHLVRVDENLGALGPAYAPMAPLLRAMLSWGPTDRPSAGEAATALGELLPEMAGQDLQSLARAAVPPLLANRQEAEDTENLIGRRFQIGPPPGAQEEVTTQKATPAPGSKVRLERPESPPSGFEDEPTLKAAKRPKILTRHLDDSNSVTITQAVPPPAPPTPLRSSRKAVLGGALIGGLIGLLAVAGLAILLFG